MPLSALLSMCLCMLLVGKTAFHTMCFVPGSYRSTLHAHCLALWVLCRCHINAQLVFFTPHNMLFERLLLLLSVPYALLRAANVC